MDIDSLLKPFHHFGIRLGLDSVFKLLANLGNPHHQVPIVHVTGTNGKGSVCAYLSSILTEAGYRTGLFTSPHLVHWTERICLNEQPISSEEFCQLLVEVIRAIDPEDQSPTQFEVITAAAWLYFARQKVDLAVIEVGLGGRLDATNVCSNPLVTIITSISRDHWQKLGPNLTDIAREKAGIFKPGCPAVIGVLPPDAEEVVRSRALELGCPIVAPPPARQVAPGWAEWEMDKSIKYPLVLQGQIQLGNSAVALAAVEILQKQGWKISEEAIINGMAKTKWLGRLQWTTWKNHQLLLDGAHNIGGAQALRDYVDSLGTGNVNWIVGMLAKKDHADILKILLRSGDRLFLVPVPDAMTARPHELAKIAWNVCPELGDCSTYPDLSLALDATFASSKGNLVIVCGSLYLVGYFLKIPLSRLG
ncbi:bifunctional folylpolyglutamate synthase/dihydrofolate synthase [Scytonema sp. UIC 10036]|uniref:Mur ligase family protein n=1 Tax=Scytonema sp. UIC 10036 TaxID=2304196 RepID=UPI00137C9766|nr:bifunctional folylpolyglutamate synthase/dihydrofolate synthase [Scytonema sp. UIC 10036]